MNILRSYAIRLIKICSLTKNSFHSLYKNYANLCITPNFFPEVVSVINMLIVNYTVTLHNFFDPARFKLIKKIANLELNKTRRVKYVFQAKQQAYSKKIKSSPDFESYLDLHLLF